MALIGINLFLCGDEIMDLGFFSVLPQSTACDDFVLSLVCLFKSIGKEKRLRNSSRCINIVDAQNAFLVMPH